MRGGRDTVTPVQLSTHTDALHIYILLC